MVMEGDISPIADLMKSEVSASSTLGVDERILQAPPTDGLWDDDRTDETQLGLSYDDLEDAMENDSSINRLKYSQIRRLNLHKMEPIPVCKMPKSKLARKVRNQKKNFPQLYYQHCYPL